MDIKHNHQHQQIDVLQEHYDIQDSEMIKLEVKESKLPQSGMGIYAQLPITVGEIIAQYYGSVSSTAQSYDPHFNEEDKMVQIDQQYCVISRGPASRANDIVKWQPEHYDSPLYNLYKKGKKFPAHKGASHNAKISINDKQKAFLRATRSINIGQQIHIDYGYDYWDFFYRYNTGKVEKIVF